MNPLRAAFVPMFLLSVGITFASDLLPAQPSTHPKVRIAALQPKARLIDYHIEDASAVLSQVEKTLGDFEGLIHRAGELKCDAVALPEDTLGLGKWEAAHKDRLKEVLPKAVTMMLGRLGKAAAAEKLYLVLCNDAINEDGSVSNTSFLVGRDGKEMGRYRKVNMPVHELDRKRGRSFPVFETKELGPVGMLICYDMIFPEAARCLALGGAGLIFHPTLGGAAIGDGDISVAAFRTRAVENFVYLVVAQRGAGSMIISPKGEILAEAKGGDVFAIAEIDPFAGRDGGDAMNYQEDMRARIFRERSPEAFSLLSDPNPPILQKVPETITVEEAVRVSSGVLTRGEEEFKHASELARAGKRTEAIEEFKRLRKRYPQSWIDRVAEERLRGLGSAPR